MLSSCEEIERVQLAFERTCLTRGERLGLARKLVRNGSAAAHLLNCGFTVQSDEAASGDRLQPNYCLTCMRAGRGFVLRHTDAGWLLRPQSVI